MKPASHFLWLLIMVTAWPFCQVAMGQSPKLKFKRISIEQGLSSSTVESIIQDKKGFIWIGTRDGLNRFDGKQMKIFRNDPADSQSISDNYIRVIFEDAQQVLWIGTTNGLNRFDPATNKFTRFKYNAADVNSISNNSITQVYGDKQKNLWIATWGGGLNLMRPGSNAFTRLKHAAGNPRSINGNQVSYIYEDSGNNLWVATSNGLNLLNREHLLFRSMNNLPRMASTPGIKDVRMIREDRAGNLILATGENGLLVYNHRDSALVGYTHNDQDRQSLASNQVRSVLVDRNWNIWVGAVNGGLDLFDPQVKGFHHYQNEPENLSSLSQRTVSALFEDKQGNLWVGTHRGGINLYTPNTEKFALYQQESRGNSLSYNDVKTFCEDAEGKIWIGTDGGGLNRFDRLTSSFTNYRYDPFKTGSLSSNEVLDVTEDRQRNLWISTWGGGLNLFNKGSQTFTRFVNGAPAAGSISSNYVQQVFEDSRDRLWVATYYGGLNIFNRNTKQFSRFTTSASGKSAISGNNIVSIAEDHEGNIWIGTDDGGLNCFRNSTGEIEHYFRNSDKSPDVRLIFADSKGRVWVGQAGLYLFNKKNNTFTLVDGTTGLSRDFIKGMEEDEVGNLWISTSNGLTKLDPNTLQSKRYNTADGLQGLEFEANAFLKTRDGQLFFGGVNGFNSFYPENIRLNSFVPPVYLTGFQLFNKEVIPGDGSPLNTDIALTRSISLSHEQSTFSFDFAALNYMALENNQYAYKLEGWDKDWQYVQGNSKASYTNIPPDNYIFRVKAANNDGIWNEEGLSLQIVITPPFYDTWWFRILIIAGSIGAIITFFLLKRKTEIRRLSNEKKEEIHQLQLQFFTNISHEFRTPLSLIMGPLEKLRKSDSPPATDKLYQVMQRNANRLMNLINELMDFRKAETGALVLNVMPGNLELFVNEVASEFSEIASEKRIRFNVEYKGDFTELWFDRQVLEKIIINLVGNSFKYTADGGAISVMVLDSIQDHRPSFINSLQVKSDFAASRLVHVIVSDNGIGISAESIGRLFERYYKITDSHLGSGIGLAFVKSLAKLHKAGIQVYSERNKGTEIILSIPASQQDYTADEKWNGRRKDHVALESVQAIGDLQPATQPDVAGSAGKSTMPGLKARILIVDDNEELRNFLDDSLGDEYLISKAADGNEGLAKAIEEMPDLIISDLMMPGMDGIEFCMAVREDPEIRHIPFIMLTARDAIESRLKGTMSGADHYFSKPVSIELLLLTIRNILGQRLKLKNKYVLDHYADSREQVHSSRDKEFVNELIVVIEEHLTNPEMDVEYICTRMGMSKTKLYQRVKAVTGQSIGEFIRSIRFKKAVQLMTEEDISLTEVMYSVGIQTQSYFTKAFKNEFGKTPTQFLKDLKK